MRRSNKRQVVALPQKRGWRYHRLRLEGLEDRTLLSNLGDSLSTLFDGLQGSVNNNLLSPTQVSYSLPLVGTALGTNGSAQFLHAIGTTIKNANPNSSTDVQTALESSSLGSSATVTQVSGSGSSTEWEIQIKNAPAITINNLDFATGLPGLSKLNISLSPSLTATINYAVNFYFTVDSGNAVLDATQNNASKPLVQMDVSAQYKPSTGTIRIGGGGAISLTPSGIATLNVPVYFNVDPSWNSGHILASDASGISSHTQTTIDQSADANTNLSLQIGFPTDVGTGLSLPSITLGLGLNWNLGSKSSDTGDNESPFDNKSYGQAPTLTLNLSIDASQISSFLEPLVKNLTGTLGPLAQLDNVVNFFFHPIPVLSDVLGGSVTPIDLLKDSGKASGVVALLTDVHDLIDFSTNIEKALNLLSSGPIQLVQNYTLPTDDSTGFDLRDPNFHLGSVLRNAPLAPSVAQEVSNFEKDVNNALGGTDLGSTVEMPMLDDPGLLLSALVGNNVVLFQYTLPPASPPGYSVDFSIGPIPVGPPPLAIRFDFGLGFNAGISLGYDTFGLMESSVRPADGFFLADPTVAQISGYIGLAAEADFGFVQLGAEGKLAFTYGITGIDAEPGDQGPGDQSTSTTGKNGTETVLQLPDIEADISAGGPLCPFEINGDITLDLSLFLTVGVSPFSITVNIDLGKITLDNFSYEPENLKSQPPPLATFDSIGKINNDVGSDPLLDTSTIQSKLPGTKNVLLLNMGEYASLRGNTGSGSNDEEYEIMPDKKNSNNLDVIAFGQIQPIPGANNPNTTIVVIGGKTQSLSDRYTTTETTVVESGVQANAYYIGGTYQNSFDYSGKGDTYMVGGTWDGRLSDPALDHLSHMNTLIGGSGHNTLIGGNLSSPYFVGDSNLGHPVERTPQWNLLVGGPDGYNTLYAGSAGATLRAGNHDGERLVGSVDPRAVQSQFVMIAGQGDDTMYAGQAAPVQTQTPQPLFTLVPFYGNYVFQWNERPDHQPHQLTVLAYNEINSTDTSELDIEGNQGFETWDISAITNGVKVTGSDNNNQSSSNQNPVGEIDAYGITKLSVDAHDQLAGPTGTIIGSTGGDVYNVPDLSTTTLTQVSVNLHQWSEQADQNPDKVSITGPQGNDTIGIGVEGALIDPSSGEPNYKYQWTDVQISTLVVATKSTVTYSVYTYLDKPADTLDVSASGGNETVDVGATQPCQTNISTGAGDDTISVGGEGTDGLDNIQGPLFINAGSGHNTINFDDGGEFGDIVTLTTQTSQGGVPQGLVRRYQGQLLPGYQIPGRDKVPPHYRYPLDIIFEAIGGDFMEGVNYFGPEVGIPYGVPVGQPDSSQIYVQRVLANAPTTVDMSINKGSPAVSDDQVYVGFDGGSNGETRDPNSTLDGILSLLTIKGNNHTSLVFDDEGAKEGLGYTLSDYQGTPALFRSIGNTQLSAFLFSDLTNLTLYAGNFKNNIHVAETETAAQGTTIYAGNGDNTIFVGLLRSSALHKPLGNELDGILNPLMIYGGTGTNALAMDDSADGNGHDYDLGSSSLTRDGIASIGFSNMTSVVLNASAASSVRNNIQIEGTATGTSVTVNTGSGTNPITVENLTDDSLNDIKGQLAIKEGAGAVVNLAFVDKGFSGNLLATEQYTLTSNSLIRSGMATITFDPVRSLNLYLRNNSDNVVNVDSTATVTAISAGSVSNQVLVGDPQRETLDPIQGALNISGAGSTVLSLEDQNAAVARSYVVIAKAVYFQGGGGPQINFEDLTGLVLDAGKKGNRINVESTPSGTSVTINAGTNDHISVGNSSLANIAGPLSVVGKGSNDTLLLDDHQGSSGSTYVIDANGLVDGAVAIGYQGLASITLNGSAGFFSESIRPDIYQVNGIPAVHQLTLNAQGNDNSLRGPNTTNTWEFAATGNTLNQTVAFSGMQILAGGTGNDTFVFNGAGFNGAIDGGISGTDILDFRQYGSPVTVAVAGAGAHHGVQGAATGLSHGFNDIDSFLGATVIPVDLSISGNATPKVAAGGQIVYNLTVTNISSSAQRNVSLTDTLPTNTTFVTWTASSGWSSNTPPIGSSGTVSASIASLPVGATAQFTLVVQVNSGTAGGTIISNTATVNPQPPDLSVTFTTTVVPPPLHPPFVPPLLALFNSLLGEVETVYAADTTIVDSLFGIPLLVETYNYSGNLASVTLFGINITFLFG